MIISLLLRLLWLSSRLHRRFVASQLFCSFCAANGVGWMCVYSSLLMAGARTPPRGT
ncbi:hypothetical protein K466DRAFT_290430 [Polyporus arcularius HHB13444]|uniref:Uncharacterized protein n=1 Tax=Polyporus arcularius HHB13444 TaxID=1314778 RepID=A0A5C3PXH6_9APHY|nr:hypothetical protein K466DRAFT_290430 [Polyporus arcularius HHB13444]